MSDTVEFTLNLMTKVTGSTGATAEQQLVNIIKPIITVPGESGFDVDLALLYQIAKS